MSNLNANYQKLPLDLSKNLFMDFWVKSDFFGFHWHYHPEIEICYVKRGFGQRIVGESVERFVAGDLVLLGSNLPHSWISDQAFNDSPDQMEVYVLHLDIAKMGHLLRLHEFAELESFLLQAGSGFHFEGAEEEGILKALTEFELASGLGKTLSLLSLLEKMLKSKRKRQLCKSTYVPETGKQVERRILSVCRYIHENYKQKIRLDDLASLAHMNTSAFCRFFKKVIGKTAIEYINELRINTASHELIVSDKAINQLALDNGFLSLSQFNKLFKFYNQKTPSQYRKSFLKTQPGIWT